MELLFDVQIPQKINDFEANKEKQTNAKNYFSLADIGEEKFMGMKIFEFKVCPEISAFKEEIQNDREVFSTNKYFALDSSASKEEKAIGLDKSFQDMNFFLESFANSEENLLDTDFPDQTGGFEENYCNQLTVINEENHFINEESNMTVVR